jgi:hypothetical protein
VKGHGSPARQTRYRPPAARFRALPGLRAVSHLLQVVRQAGEKRPGQMCLNTECASYRRSLKRAELDDALAALLRRVLPSKVNMSVPNDQVAALWQAIPQDGEPECPHWQACSRQDFARYDEVLAPARGALCSD